MAALNGAHQAKKQCNFDNGQFLMTSYDIASYDSCEPKRFSRRCNKVERKHVQEQQPNKIHFYNQNMGFVNRMDQSVANYKIGTQMKKWWWYPFV